MQNKGFDREIGHFRILGGVVRTREILRAGIHPRKLYEMREAGIIEQISRGVYRLAELPVLAHPDLVTVATRAPEGVICLISALSFHQMTSQVPHEVYLALDQGRASPRLTQPPVRRFWFAGAAFAQGIESHRLDGISVRIYSPEKTLADCFKYRNKIGLDVAVEALKLYHRRQRLKADAILHFAATCRVEKVMRPYLETIL